MLYFQFGSFIYSMFCLFFFFLLFLFLRKRCWKDKDHLMGKVSIWFSRLLLLFQCGISIISFNPAAVTKTLKMRKMCNFSKLYSTRHFTQLHFYLVIPAVNKINSFLCKLITLSANVLGFWILFYSGSIPTFL